MASLALFAGLTFLTVILIGPATWLLSLVRPVPDILVYCLAACSVAVGFWWIFLPHGAIQFLGMLPVVLGFAAINIRVERRREGGKSE